MTEAATPRQSAVTPPLQRGMYFVYTMETKGLFQFKIIINVLVSSF